LAELAFDLDPHLELVEDSIRDCWDIAWLRFPSPVEAITPSIVNCERDSESIFEHMVQLHSIGDGIQH
jgi:hypothetical protein